MKPDCKSIWPLLALIFLWTNATEAQQYTQSIRGVVLDQDAQLPLVGANILVLNTDPLLGTTTDLEGYFKLDEVPIGRIDLQVSYLGYEPKVLGGVMLTAGKELVLNIEMTEAINNLQEVVVKAKSDKAEALNEMAVVSARSFSVEETSRYASSFYDPARMAQNYAGVAAGGGEDLFNEIIIRGNSPRGVLWRLEGVEIPNPNHFGQMGNSGGAISMLSSSTLANSDFYTGAFPAEFGNAISGVFDLNMRNGNNEKREYAFMLGALGIEASAEGPFTKNSRASYLFNYRYSTLAALNAVGLNPAGDVLPEYQDLSFKINVPTASAGTFSIFGLAGNNKAYFDPAADSAAWESGDDKWGFTEKQAVGTIGLSHRILLSDNSYLKTVAVASLERYDQDDYWLDVDNDYEKKVDEVIKAQNSSYRLSSTYTHKFDARNTVRAGLILSHLTFDFVYDEEEGEGLIRYFDNDGATNFLQSFAQWKYRIDDRWTLNTGLHYNHFFLNGNYAVEPRVALSWDWTKKQRLGLAVGLHSKLEHLAVYLFDGELPWGGIHEPGTDLELTKSMHAVLSYDHRLSDNLRLKTELYYQHLYDIPVETIEPDSRRSIINAADIWDVIGAQRATNEGTGRNYGVDLTLERFFANSYYFMLTGSLYESKYTPIDGVEYDTRYNGNYQLNVLGGKEIKLGYQGKNTLGLNGKFILSGGARYTPIDLAASRAEGEAVYFEDRSYAARTGPYYRFDVGLSYRINGAGITHSVMLDIQNVTNRLNVFSQYYSTETQNIEKYYQTGLFPVFNYRIEF